MKQDRLHGVAQISIEHELAQRIEVEAAVKTFAAMEADTSER